MQYSTSGTRLQDGVPFGLPNDPFLGGEAGYAGTRAVLLGRAPGRDLNLRQPVCGAAPDSN